MTTQMSPPPVARSKGPWPILIAIVAGVGCGLYPLPWQGEVAKAILGTFLNVLRLVSLPIVFLAVSTTIMGMPSLGELARLGRRTLGYALLTTVLSASVALCFYLLIAPRLQLSGPPAAALPGASDGYLSHLNHIVPSSLFVPFIEGNITAILVMATAFGAGMLTVSDRALVQKPLAAVLAGLLTIVTTVIRAVPLVVWAGIIDSFASLRDSHTLRALGAYLLVVVAANVVQGALVLPAVLRLHGIPVAKSVRAMWPALTTAFFGKSSVAAMPIAIGCAEGSLAISPRVARFCFPLCTSINMNGCAAFILATVLFVSEAHGHSYTLLAKCGWVLLASLAALGNAGVPMGCYVLACSLLGTMGVPLEVMALILPFYGFIDMLETAVNVWSDATVTLCVAKSSARDVAEPEAASTAHLRGTLEPS